MLKVDASVVQFHDLYSYKQIKKIMIITYKTSYLKKGK